MLVSVFACQNSCNHLYNIFPCKQLRSLSFLLLCQVQKASAQYQNLSLSSACEAVLEIGNAGNVYMDERAPWSLFKQGGTAAEAAAKVCSYYFYHCKILTV